MASPNSRQAESLYIIIMRDDRAPSLFKSWINENRVKESHIQDNKLHLYDQYAFQTFMVSWKHWENLVIWDTWNRKHVYI